MHRRRRTLSAASIKNGSTGSMTGLPTARPTIPTNSVARARIGRSSSLVLSTNGCSIFSNVSTYGTKADSAAAAADPIADCQQKPRGQCHTRIILSTFNYQDFFPLSMNKKIRSLSVQNLADNPELVHPHHYSKHQYQDERRKVEGGCLAKLFLEGCLIYHASFLKITTTALQCCQ